MTTVGYGEIVPVTNIGRMFTIFACFAGNVIIQTMTLVLMKKLQLLDHEEKVLKHFENSHLKVRLKHHVVALLQRFAKYIALMRTIHRKLRSGTKLSIQDFKDQMKLKNEMAELTRELKSFKILS